MHDLIFTTTMVIVGYFIYQDYKAWRNTKARVEAFYAAEKQLKQEAKKGV